MELEKIIADRFKTFEESGKIQEIIDTQLENTTRSAIRGIFDWDLEKQIKEALKDKLQINFGSLDIEPYMTTVCDKVCQMVKMSVEDSIYDKTSQYLNEILGCDKQEFKMSEIVSDLMDGKDFEDGDKEITLIIQTEKSTYTYLKPEDRYHVWLDEEADVNKEDCKYHFVANENGTMNYIFAKKESWASAEWINTRCNDMIQKALFSAQFRGTKIIFDKGYDADDYNICESEYDY